MEGAARPVLIAVVLLAWATASHHDARTGLWLPWSNYAISVGVVVVATAIIIGLQLRRGREYTWGESFWTLFGVVLLLMLPVSLVRYVLGLG